MSMCKSENGHEDRCSCDNCGLEYGDLTAKLRLAVEELKRAGGYGTRTETNGTWLQYDPLGEKLGSSLTLERQGTSRTSQDRRTTMSDTTQDERLEMDAGAGESDYPYVLIFTTDKFVISAFGFDPEHCEDRLQCILKGRYESQKGDREMRRI